MMRFLFKIGMQRTLGWLPGGMQLHSFIQRHVTRSVQPNLSSVLQKRDVVRMYDQLAQRLTGQALAAHGPHVDIGTGWLLTIPLAMRQAGVLSQIATDIHAEVQLAAVAKVAAMLDGAAGPGDAQLGQPGPGQSLTQWLAQLGIEYRAPARAPFDLPPGAYGLVTCTQVLMHPPRDTVGVIYAEAARLLRPGGLFVVTVKLYDIYSHSDPTLPRFHFYRYSHAAWRRWFDNPFTPLNRLCPSDHRQLLSGLPFDVLEWRVDGGGPKMQAELSRAPVHSDFAGYAPEELAATQLTFVLRRRIG